LKEEPPEKLSFKTQKFDNIDDGKIGIFFFSGFNCKITLVAIVDYNMALI